MNQSQFDNEVRLMAQRLVDNAEQEYRNMHYAQTLNDDDVYVFDFMYNKVIKNLGVKHDAYGFTYPVAPNQALLKGMKLRHLLSKLQGA